MRDVVAAMVAVLLIFFALRLATSLTRDQVTRRRLLRKLEAEGQSVLAEIPTDNGLVFFTEDANTFRFGDRVIEKHLIQSARVLINGAAIAASARESTHSSDTVARDIVQERDEGISRDRWDVAIATAHDTTVVPCGAIREQISQEIARRIFGAIRRTIETSN